METIMTRRVFDGENYSYIGRYFNDEEDLAFETDDPDEFAKAYEALLDGGPDAVRELIVKEGKKELPETREEEPEDAGGECCNDCGGNCGKCGEWIPFSDDAVPHDEEDDEEHGWIAVPMDHVSINISPVGIAAGFAAAYAAARLLKKLIRM